MEPRLDWIEVFGHWMVRRGEYTLTVWRIGGKWIWKRFRSTVKTSPRPYDLKEDAMIDAEWELSMLGLRLPKKN